MRILLPFVIAVLALPAQTHAAQSVSVSPFRSVELRGGGDVEIVPGPVQRVILLTGSTAFTSFTVEHGGKLRIDACNSRCPRNYPLHIRIETPRMPDVAIRAGGKIVAGRSFAPMREISAAVSAGGTIDLRALVADDVSAAVNAGGDIYVRPRLSLSAAVNAGGDIHYSGRPRVSMAVSNGGDVRREN
ncbi:MAG: hypothetical protein QOD54_1023 [Sphingomonadales bacterium]|nr:hypothetical protein [Sphingomonadales bacterium]